MSMPFTAAIASTFSSPSSDSTDTQVGIGPWRILGHVTIAETPVAGVHPLPRDAMSACLSPMLPTD
jgi:hypothetical protein